MSKHLILASVVCFAVAVTAVITSAQQSDQPVIVVFRDDAPLGAFAGNYREDPRERANPRAWEYLDRAVVAAVQALEVRGRFVADHVYSATVRGFSARLTDQQIDALRNHPLVAYIESDGTMSVTQSKGKGGNGDGSTGGQMLPWGIKQIGADVSSTRAGDGSGAIDNVTAYVIDTGIDIAHSDLNVIDHMNFSGDAYNVDCHGHGTHVAGTIAATDNAIDVVSGAPGAPLVGVKVLTCWGFGFTSSVIKGVDWVARHARVPAVANMSLGGPVNETLDRAMTRAVDRGVVFAVAAANAATDACQYSPARLGTQAGVITTAALDSGDQEATFSNYGSCVDIWAPGVTILSTKLGGGTRTYSGTSMASPHVGGTAALYLSSHPGATPADAEAALKQDAIDTNTVSKDGRSIFRVYAGRY